MQPALHFADWAILHGNLVVVNLAVNATWRFLVPLSDLIMTAIL